MQHLLCAAISLATLAEKLKVVAFGKPKQKKKRNIRNITLRIFKAREGIKTYFFSSVLVSGKLLGN